MGWAGALQVFRPGGITNEVGSPNFLIDLSTQCYQAQWTKLFQGGLDKAQFDCRMIYEDTLDLVGGNWVIFGLTGGVLTANGNPGDSSVTISDVKNVQAEAAGVNVHDLISGDLVMLTDGINTELFTCGTIQSAGGGSWKVPLNPAWNTTQIATKTSLATKGQAGDTHITVANGKALNANEDFVLGPDKYTVGAGYSGGTTVPITSPLTANYPAYTPISIATAGAGVIHVLDGASVPVGQAWLDSGWIDQNGSGKQESVQVASHGGDTNQLNLTGTLGKNHAAGAPLLYQMKGTLSNSFAAGSAILVRVMFQGYLLNRVRASQHLNTFSVAATGFFNRYNFLMDSSTVTNQSSAEQARLDLASYASTIPGIIVNNSTPGKWLAINSGVKINLQEQDVQFTELLDAILRQENGNSMNEQYAIWVDEDRLVRHLPVATAPNYRKGTATPTYYLSLADFSTGLDPKLPTYADTVDVVQTTDEDMTNLMNAAIVTGTNAPDSSGVKNINATTCAEELPQGQTTLKVTSVPSTWPSSGSGLKVFVNRQNTPPDYISSQGDEVRVASSFGKNVNPGDTVELVTHTTAQMNPGDQSCTVANAHIFSSGQECTLTPTGSTEESLTIQTINYSSGKITFTTAAKKTHAANNIVCLANNGGGSAPRILVEQKDSIYGWTENGKTYAGFGFYEGQLDSQDIYDETALRNWAAKQLSVLAWPQSKTQVQLSTTSARITGRDLVQIGPFNDGSFLIQNVQSIQYNATAADKNISATINLGVMRSTAQGVMREIAKQRARRQRYHQQTHKGSKNHVSHGHGISQTDVNQITVDAGTVKLNGLVYQVSGITSTVPEGESRWGANCGPGVVSAGVVEMPKRWWNGRYVYSHSGVYEIDQIGDQPQLVDSFVGVALWKVKCRNGVIVGIEPLFDPKGVNLGNLPSSTTPAAPSTTGFAPSAASQANLIAGDVTLSGMVVNFPTDGTSAEMKFYVRTTGTTNWAHKQTQRATGLPQPSQSQSVATVLHGLPLGEQLDFGMSFDGFNGEGPITMIASGYVMPPVPAALTAPIQILVAAPTPGSSSPTPVNGNGTFGIYAGGNINQVVWLYTTASGWRPVLMQG